MAIIAQPGILVINLFIIMATKTGRSHAYNDLLLANDLLLQISLAVFFGQHKYFLLPYFVRLPLGRILNFLYTISGVCVSCFALLPAACFVRLPVASLLKPKALCMSHFAIHSQRVLWLWEVVGHIGGEWGIS